MTGNGSCSFRGRNPRYETSRSRTGTRTVGRDIPFRCPGSTIRVDLGFDERSDKRSVVLESTGVLRLVQGFRTYTHSKSLVGIPTWGFVLFPDLPSTNVPFHTCLKLTYQRSQMCRPQVPSSHSSFTDIRYRPLVLDLVEKGTVARGYVSRFLKQSHPPIVYKINYKEYKLNTYNL